MKRYLLAGFMLFVCAPLFAIEVDPKLDHAVRESIPVCAGSKLTYEALDLKLPARFTGTLVKVESGGRPLCDGQFAAILSPTGGFFFGRPWLIADEEGKTIEEKLKNFTWRNLEENVTAVIDRSHDTDGLFPATLVQTTENGTMPIPGEVDADGRIFFFGPFRRFDGDMRKQRASAFDAFLADSPAKGDADGAITVVEFSDFECPSCKRASGIADDLLARFGKKVRYVRFDMPLTMHPWAFPAALVGRAIHRQNPELFWKYKKEVYANQEQLNAFMFWDWARGFAQDHDLDLKRYDADLASSDLKKEILDGAGFALANDVRATPSYMVNGAMVDPGTDGKALISYVDSLIAK